MRVETEDTILEEYKMIATVKTINIELLFVEKREKLMNQACT